MVGSNSSIVGLEPTLENQLEINHLWRKQLQHLLAWYTFYWKDEETVGLRPGTVSPPEFGQDQNSITLLIPKPPFKSLVPVSIPKKGGEEG